VEGNTEMDLRQVRWGDVDWIKRACGRDEWRALVNTIINLLIV
jgi:hypothetical protein